MILLVDVVKCSENITPAQTVHTSDREIEMPDMLQKPYTFASSGNFLVNVTVNKLDAPRDKPYFCGILSMASVNIDQF
jgi:hypothetical protein